MVVNACAEPENWLNGWRVLSFIGILVSYFVISLLYMLGSFMGNPGLTARAKNEMYQVLVTALFLASIILFVSVACNVDVSGVGLGVGGNMYYVAELYLAWLRDMVASTLASFIFLSHVVLGFTSFSAGVPITFVTVYGQPFTGMYSMMTLLNLLINVLSISLLVTIAQIVTLKIIEVSALNVLLPVGVVCRSFPITRRFGGALMAIAIGLYIGYPFLLVLDFAFMGQSTSIADVSSLSLVWDAFKSNFISIAAGVYTGNPLMSLYAVQAFALDLFLNTVIARFAPVIVAAFLLPAINGIVLVVLVRELSRALGEEVDISTLTKVV